MDHNNIIMIQYILYSVRLNVYTVFVDGSTYYYHRRVRVDFVKYDFIKVTYI